MSQLTARWIRLFDDRTKNLFVEFLPVSSEGTQDSDSESGFNRRHCLADQAEIAQNFCGVSSCSFRVLLGDRCQFLYQTDIEA